jgi:hypothetical protein
MQRPGHDHPTGVHRMKTYMTTTMRWKPADLHDACVHMGCSVGAHVSMLKYFSDLHATAGDAKTAFQPQGQRTHTVANIKACLKALQRGGRQLGLQGTKKVLAERLALCLQHVMQQATFTESALQEELDATNDANADFASDDDLAYQRRQQKFPLKMMCSSFAAVPESAVVDATMAESALGHNLADEFDEDLLSCDKDVRAEEEQLLKVPINVPGVDYTCLSVKLAYMPKEQLPLFGVDSDTCPVGALSASSFALTDAQARATLADSCQEQQAIFKREAFTAENRQRHHEELRALDPTQRLVYDVVHEWAQREQRTPGTHPPLRLVVLGTAGTGKTFTTKCAVAAARLAFGDFDAVAMVAHTGVAAANMGSGATTIDRLFNLGGDKSEEDLSDQALDSLVESLKNVKLLVIDEVSTVGAAQFEMIHRRLEQVNDYMCQLKLPGRAPSTADFGNFGLLLVGDFGQLPPVCASSLISSTPQEHYAGAARSHASQGQRRFQSMHNVIRLRRIYRQSKADEFKDSTIRLRDYVCKPSDYDLWKQHELSGDLTQPHWDGSEGLLENALSLVVENEACGSINGKRLRAMSAHADVIRALATHTDDRGAQRPADEYRQVRSLTHLCVGAPVMLTQNHIWGESVVSLGLMNGARGRVIAILYKAPGESRTDGLSIPTGFPNGLLQCPMPDLVIVHFPGYVGRRFFRDLPSTWVPVPCVEVRHERRKSSCRLGLPLRLSWAMTVHKSQGITAKEGVIIDFQVSKSRNPVASAGLAFVALTRAESFTRVAFKNMPSFHSFLAPRTSKEFGNRQSYEKSAAEWSETFTMHLRGWSVEDEYLQHIRWSSDRLGRLLEPDEQNDIKSALTAKGVMPMDPDVIKWLQDEVQLGRNATMADIARAFRGHRPKQREGIGKAVVVEPVKKKTKTTEVTQDMSDLHATTVRDPCLFLLVQLGIPEKLAKYALRICGRDDMTHVFDFCETHAAEEIEDWDEHLTQVTQQYTLYEQSRDLLKIAGFDPSLVHPAGNGHVVLTMGDVGPAGHRRQQTLARRRSSVRCMECLPISNDLFQEYKERASTEWPECAWQVFDFGQAASRHNNACFWLSVVAGWSRCSQYFQDTGWMTSDLQSLASRVHALSHLSLVDMNTHRPLLGTDELGKCAHALRVMVTGGPHSVMLQNSRTWYPAFACLQGAAPSQTSATLSDFHSWLLKVASTDFADELVVAATAQLLRLCIRIVPHTPPDAQRPWAIVEHPCRESHHRFHITPHTNIVLGNNDVHYVLLSS